MKSKFIRAISFLLVMAFLVSCFAVFAFADNGAVADEADEENVSSMTLYYNRDFSEGWNAANGVTVDAKGNGFVIANEETENFGTNYFLQFNKNSTQLGATDGSITLKDQLAFSEGKLVLEFDIKTDDYCDMGNIIIGNMPTINTSNNNAATANRILASIVDGKLYLADGEYKSDYSKQGDANHYVADITGKDWIRVAIMIDMDVKVCTCGVEHNMHPGQPCPTCSNDVLGDVVHRDEAASLSYTCNACGAKYNNDTLMKCQMKYHIYYSYAEDFDFANAIDATHLGTAAAGEKDLTKTYYYVASNALGNAVEAGWNNFKIGVTNEAETGYSYAIDNLKLYKSATGFEKITSDMGHGTFVDEEAVKDVVIDGAGGVKTPIQIANEGLVMKLGVANALYASKKTQILVDEATAEVYGAPLKIDGTVYVPLQAILDYMGYPMLFHEDGVSVDIAFTNGSAFITIGRTTATVNGKIVDLEKAPAVAKTESGLGYVVVAMEDVDKIFEGYYATYDEMGLIIISEMENVLDRDTYLDTMLDLMKAFVFDTLDTSEDVDNFYNEVKKNTNDFTHPYLLADQNKFDTLHSAYLAEGGDATLKKMLTDAVAAAELIYQACATADKKVEGASGEGMYLAADLSNPNLKTDGIHNGYDKYSERLTAIVDYTSNLKDIAFAYQVTRQDKYARIAYEAANALAQWAHWGPAHFINCAEATYNYALAYDWLYSAWVDMGFDVSVIENAIYDKGLLQAYNASGAANGIPSCSFVGLDSNNAKFEYTTMTDVWNPVCTSAMVISSLAVLGVEGRAELTSVAKWLISNNIKTLIENGLDHYAPDGSYIESASAWQRATTSVLNMIWALDRTYGSDMGLLDLWGFENTFYYALQLEFVEKGYDSEALTYYTGYSHWNYHDTTEAFVDTQMFFIAAELLGDEALAAFRMQQIAKKPTSYLDALAYKPEYAALDASGITLPLTQLFYSLDAVVARSDWSDGCLYVGIMGGRNDVDGGQVDSGNFVYSNGGVNWFCDMGGDDSDLHGYFNSEKKYGYYRNTGEGANIVVITSDGASVPHGQTVDGKSKLTRYEANDYGFIASFDNTGLYGPDCVYAARTMMLTNNRTTVVLQDEITFGGIQSVAWLAHTAASIKVSKDGKVAVLSKKIGTETQYVRATIMNATDGVEFSILDAGVTDYLLSGTHSKSYSLNNGGKAEENSRSGIKRLAILNENVSVKFTIVIESVVGADPDNQFETVKFNYSPNETVLDWKIAEAYVSPEESGATIKTPLLSDIKTYGQKAFEFYDAGMAFDTRLKDFYKNLVIATNCVLAYRKPAIVAVADLVDHYNNYAVYSEAYKAYRDDVNKIMKSEMNIGANLGGYDG